jgi:hypothetical protein
VRLRNKGSDAVSLYRPAGDIGSLIVEPDEEFEIPGVQVTKGVPEGADYVLVESPDGELRAYALSRWELVTESVASPSVPADLTTAKDEG